MDRIDSIFNDCSANSKHCSNSIPECACTCNDVLELLYNDPLTLALLYSDPLTLALLSSDPWTLSLLSNDPLTGASVQ